MPARWRRALGVEMLELPIAPAMEAYDETLEHVFDGRPRGPDRGEPPGADPRQPADGAVEQVRLARADDRQQVRDGGRLLDAVRRQRRRLRGDQGLPEDARLRARAVSQRARRRRGPDPGSRSSTARRARSSATTSATRTRCLRTTCSTRSSRATSRTTSGATSWCCAGSTPTDVDRVIALVDRAEYKRRQAPPGIKITTKGVRARPADADHEPIRGLSDGLRESQRSVADGDRHPRQHAQPPLVVGDLDLPHPRGAAAVLDDCASRGWSLRDRPQEARLVREARRDLARRPRRRARCRATRCSRRSTRRRRRARAPRAA